MGLDMYLRATQYVSGREYMPPEVQKKHADLIALTGLPFASDSPGATVTSTVIYWRKTNAIHGWFVEHCQGGRDECQVTPVPRHRLEELLEIVRGLLSARAESEVEGGKLAWALLPPTTGFFFGGDTLDVYYWSDLERTETELAAVLESVPETAEFEYEASW